MIDQLVTALREAGREADARELADALWLASKIERRPRGRGRLSNVVEGTIALALSHTIVGEAIPIRRGERRGATSRITGTPQTTATVPPALAPDVAPPGQSFK